MPKLLYTPPVGYPDRIESLAVQCSTDDVRAMIWSFFEIVLDMYVMIDQGLDIQSKLRRTGERTDFDLKYVETGTDRLRTGYELELTDQKESAVLRLATLVTKHQGRQILFVLDYVIQIAERIVTEAERGCDLIVSDGGRQIGKIESPVLEAITNMAAQLDALDKQGKK
ncbi:MAG: hypothetical protein A2751_00390 [Candidatus Doudnabacteria bacterium RIFCSPHIGHO2_01_FULL_46_14]|uniref:Uncharacterized protein n=1 Tax=Candidatus Doudnabacteria bacterium RIFCSPHIGHO2_01_FULL_46_14 TaxID=1817824 RepID=A0A1F5NPJ1_9BACT|nr:MAG: hypothetical protein A2751_00390 [Candidatus Doudnabacteria bacterium RIFCSPHIGHO2_01_FULL_46_14]